jgi:hypothetical protein
VFVYGITDSSTFATVSEDIYLTYGSLKFSASFDAEAGPSAGGSFGLNPLGGTTIAFDDSLTITSQNLPAGTPVQVLETVAWTWSSETAYGNPCGLDTRDDFVGQAPDGSYEYTIYAPGQTH